jgi:hypothetical protein
VWAWCGMRPQGWSDKHTREGGVIIGIIHYHQCQRSGGKNADNTHGHDQVGCHSSGEHKRDGLWPQFDY